MNRELHFSYKSLSINEDDKRILYCKGTKSPAFLHLRISLARIINLIAFCTDSGSYWGGEEGIATLGAVM